MSVAPLGQRLVPSCGEEGLLRQTQQLRRLTTLAECLQRLGLVYGFPELADFKGAGAINELDQRRTAGVFLAHDGP